MMQPLPTAERTARLADMVLGHRLAQQFPYAAVELLRSIERGDDDINPADADRLLQLAVEAVVTAELAAMRQASAPAA